MAGGGDPLPSLIQDLLGFGLSVILLAGGLLGLWALHRNRLGKAGFSRSPPREFPLWTGVEVALCFLVYFLATSAAYAALGAPGGATAPGGGVADEALVHTVALAAGDGAAALLAVLLVRVALRQPLRALGLRGSAPRNLVALLLLFVFSFPVLGVVGEAWVLFLDAAWGVTPAPQPAVELVRESLGSGETGAVVLLAFAAVLVAPVGEELLFRGLLFGLLRARWGFSGAAAVSSALFGLVHFHLPALLPLVFVGALLAYAYERTGSLYLTILYHAVFNGSQILILFLAGGG